MSIFLNDEQLLNEYLALARQHAEVQMRCSKLIASQAEEITRLDAERMRLRAAVIRRDTELAYERERYEALFCSIPSLPKRLELVVRVKTLTQRIESMMRDRRRDVEPTKTVSVQMQSKAILCIGFGNEAAMTKELVEKAGGRFVHLEDKNDQEPEVLDTNLSAADLVICQTGCISHNAIWRVRDRCKRTGKKCILAKEAHVLQFFRHAAMHAAVAAEAADTAE